jgi:hypothetical protein
MPNAADQSQWRRHASEFKKVNIDLPKGKLPLSLLRIYIVFLKWTNEPNPWILCVLIHDTLKRIRVRRIRKSTNSMWPLLSYVKNNSFILYSSPPQTSLWNEINVSHWYL